MSVWDYINAKMTTLKNEVIAQREKVETLLGEKMPEVQEVLKESQQSASDVMSQAIPQIQDALIKTTEIITEKTTSFIESLQSKDHTMEHKVLMMGGKRAGKSTILASILHLLKDAPGDLCTISDVTDYTQVLIGKDGKEYSLPTLDEKRREVVGYIRDISEKTSFLVDLTSNQVHATYNLLVNTSYKRNNKVEVANIRLDFVDVPGEWMRKGVAEHSQLVDEVKSSDVFVIAIDTPYLMQDDIEVNEIYNRIPEIADTLEYIHLGNEEADWKQIIFCPIKCEKWAKEGRLFEVTRKIKTAYKQIINRWVQIPNIQIWVMPIQTVGALVFDNHREAKLFFKDENDQSGTLCSEDERTGVILDGNGDPVTDFLSKRGLEFDLRWKIDGIKIPVSWYKICGREFSSLYCEQPGYHILRFLVNKEEHIEKMKAESEKKELNELKKKWLGKFRAWLKLQWNPTFGVYLPVWKDLIIRLEKRNLIKETGDGFERVTTIVNDSKLEEQ